VCHALNPINYEGKTEDPGFDFLGFNIRQYPAGKICKGISKTFLTHIKPRQKAIKTHTKTIKDVIKRHKTAPQSALMSYLN
jgi:RNA-directed DNA polymerase